MKVDAVASYGHYWSHVAPVFRALPDDIRGDIYAPPALNIPGSMSLRDAGKDPDRLSIVAGHPDLVRLRYRTGIMMEHGIGQSYGGAPQSASHPAHPGGDRRDKAVMFLHPNEQAAARDRARYPAATVHVIGSPRLAELQQLPRPAPSDRPCIAVASHWPSGVSKESGSAWGYWSKAFANLAATSDYEVIGHGHPRTFRQIAGHYRRMGIEPVETLEEVACRAHCYVFDNSSSGYEMSGIGCPVVVLDAPWYRTTIRHGARFWDWADIGPRILLPDALPNAIHAALNKQPWPHTERILTDVFPPIAEPAAHAAALITDHAARLTRIGA